jgi:hypothetical protein
MLTFASAGKPNSTDRRTRSKKTGLGPKRSDVAHAKMPQTSSCVVVTAELLRKAPQMTESTSRTSHPSRIVVISELLFFFIRVTLGVVHIGYCLLGYQIIWAILFAEEFHAIFHNLTHVATGHQDRSAKVET